jgi:hypothetical protein
MKLTAQEHAKLLQMSKEQGRTIAEIIRRALKLTVDR